MHSADGNISIPQGHGTIPLFLAEFTESYSLRNLIEYLKGTSNLGNFIFTREGITFTRADMTNTILNHVLIRASDLSLYAYNSSEPEVFVGMPIVNLRKLTKPIGKKDTVRLYMLPGEPLFHVQILNMNTKVLNRNNSNFVRPQLCEEIEYDLGTFTRSDENPNCTIPVVDFCRMCTGLSSLQSPYVTVRGLPRGVIFEGIVDGDLTGRIDKFGIVDNNSNPELTYNIPDHNPAVFSDIRLEKLKGQGGKAPRLAIRSQAEASEIRVRIKVSTIKALAKINSLSPPGGMIKVYIERDVPIKFVCNIGNYGKLTIYLRDVESCN